MVDIGGGAVFTSNFIEVMFFILLLYSCNIF
jgi:hypothetical protein